MQLNEYKLLSNLQDNIPQKGYFFNLLSTRSWALLFAFPEMNSTTPVMSGEVCRRVSLWTVPIFSRSTRELGCKGSPFRLHTGALRTGTETSHSKQASSGAMTSTSFSSLTINSDWAESVHRREGQMLAYSTDFRKGCLLVNFESDELEYVLA